MYPQNFSLPHEKNPAEGRLLHPADTALGGDCLRPAKTLQEIVVVTSHFYGSFPHDF